MPKPKNALFDLNSPIYKKGDPQQAGEAGKAVNIDKTVLIVSSIVGSYVSSFAEAISD